MEIEDPIEPQPKPTFSPWRRYSIGLNVFLIIIVVFAVVVMVNYLARDYSKRFYVSSQVQRQLSPQTLKFLGSLTNRVKIVVYYDRGEPFYSTVVGLLNEYKSANSRITIEGVDYLRDAGAAQRIKAQYKLTFPGATNLIIFDCEGKKWLPVDGNMLTQYDIEQLPSETQREYRKKPVAFKGEQMFTSALIEVTSAKRTKAYFLAGHGEHPFNSADPTYGYQNFSAILEQLRVEPQTLSLKGSNAVPLDGMLIVAGPQQVIHDVELQKIDDYLFHGGRLMILFNLFTTNKETGLEKLLAKWGVEVGRQIIKDPDPEHTWSGHDIIVDLTSRHPLVNSLMTMQLQMVEPRSVAKLAVANAPADAPLVEEVAFSGPNAFPQDDLLNRKKHPLITTVEKGAIKGVITERGATRIIVAGDSLFLVNQQIGSVANADFASCAVNWLLARTELLGGVGQRAVANYRITMSTKQMRRAELVLMGGMPGAILLTGGLVWLRRRK